MAGCRAVTDDDRGTSENWRVLGQCPARSPKGTTALFDIPDEIMAAVEV